MALLVKICLICNKEFHVHAYRISTAKFCSFECRNISYKNKHFSPQTEFKNNQIFSKARNKKISKAHKGKQKVDRIALTCPVCKKIFYVIPSFQFRIYCSLKCFYRDPAQLKRMQIQGKNQVFTSERNNKISKAMKGRLPKNWTTILKHHNKFIQKKMYKIIKRFFPKAKWEYKVTISPVRRRFLDVAICENKIDFEYDGLIHQSKKVQENDRIRTLELEQLGWKVVRFNKNNFSTIETVCFSLLSQETNNAV